MEPVSVAALYKASHTWLAIHLLSLIHFTFLRILSQFSIFQTLPMAKFTFSLIFLYILLSMISYVKGTSDYELVKDLIREGKYTSPPIPDPTNPTAVLSKDMTINKLKHTWARIFLPHKVLNNPPPTKLPLIVFYHGGGFIAYSASSINVHVFLFNLANVTDSIVVSVDYRLAPKHRLPTAYDDSYESLQWIKASNDLWLTRYADYRRCYLMGESAGGNIAYFVGLHAAKEADLLAPLEIHGIILIQPFFGGIHRTSSEQKNKPHLEITDAIWRMSLPIGADRDHVYSNTMVNGGAKELDQIQSLRWKVVVFGSGQDILVDRQREFVHFLNIKGVNVMGYFYCEGEHGIFLNDAEIGLA